MDRYVVIGNPVAHSLSPRIHALFASQLGESLEYSTLDAPREDFASTARAFFDGGGRGANVTLPFKIDALRFASKASDRARLAGAANFLASRSGAIEADNTDGAGLVADLAKNLRTAISGSRVLILGAGGAARGVIAPLLAQRPARLVIANRSAARARDLAANFASLGAIEAAPLDAIPDGDFDIVVNATSTSVQGEALRSSAARHGRAWARLRHGLRRTPRGPSSSMREAAECARPTGWACSWSRPPSRSNSGEAGGPTRRQCSPQLRSGLA